MCHESQQCCGLKLARSVLRTLNVRNARQVKNVRGKLGWAGEKVQEACVGVCRY